jgi:hypothetical protein
MSLQQTGGVIEAFKPGQTPGAQTTDSLLAGTSSLTSPPDATTPTQPTPTNGQPTPPAQSTANVNKQLGGLY